MDEKETPKNRFEGEMTRMMDIAISKIEGLDNRFDGLETRFDGLEKDVSEIKSDISVIKGQFSDVAVMTMGDNKRITKLEDEVAELQSNIH